MADQARVPHEGHPVFVSLHELFVASASWWFSWGLVVPSVAGGILFGLLQIPSSASVAHRDSVAIAGVVGVAWSLLANFHRVRQERDVARYRPVGEEHRELLFGLLRGVQNQAPSGQRASFGDPPLPRPQSRRKIALAHFPALMALVDDWNAAVDRTVTAPTALSERVTQAWSQTKFHPGITHRNLLMGRVAGLIDRQASSGVALDLSFDAAGIWTHHFDVKESSLMVSLRDNPDANSYSSVATVYGVESDRVDAEADDLVASINALVTAALGWQETAERADAQRALREFPSEKIFDAVASELLRSQVFPALGCADCEATHGLPKPRVAHERLPWRAYRAACQREDAPREALRS
jgi:hypothetical protein